MKQKVLIEVDTKKPISQLGNNVLFFDSTKKCYYALSQEEFLSGQNAKIRALEEKVKVLDKECKDYQKALSLAHNTAIQELREEKQKMQNEIAAFKQQYNQDKQEFLAMYKETNAKIIEMVKSFVNEGE